MSKGYILFEGASLIDGAPIAVIATMASNNSKTGLSGKRNMVQTWVIRTDIAPHDAVKTGQDVSVCGDCQHKPTEDDTCYVTVFQAPLAVYKGYKKGIYSRDIEKFYSEIENRSVRFGAYGDPAAAPTELWRDIASKCKGITGYTHQWERAGFDIELLDYVMASVDNPEQAARVGSRYFRVKTPDSPVLAGEVECLSDSKGLKCSDCLVCDGGDKGKSIYITAHGAKANKFNDVIAIG
jgi:hypothetical protein